MNVTQSLLTIALLIALSAFFSTAEISLAASRRLRLRQMVDDGDARLPVVYTGILPDLFRENQSVVATGRMRGKVFVAEEVLAKHDETYMPKEVADKMAQAHKKHQVQDAQPAPAAGTP